MESSELRKIRNNLKSRGYSHLSHGIWLKPIDEKEDRALWLKERTNGIGGSDIGTMMGFNPNFKCSAELFREKSLLYDVEEYNRFTKWGTKSEKDILDVAQYYDFNADVRPGNFEAAYIDNWHNNNKLRVITEFPFMIINEKYPWIIANIDGAIDWDEESKTMGSIAEAKNTTTIATSKYVNGLNPNYLVQALTYSLVLNPILRSPSTKVFMRLDGNDMMAVNVVLNDYDDLRKDIIHESRIFYNRVKKAREIREKMTGREMRKALRRLEPGPDDSKRYNNFISEEWKALQNRKKINGGPWERNYLVQFEKFKFVMKDAEKQKLYWENKLKESMVNRGADELSFKDGSYVRWGGRFTTKLKD